MIKLFLYFILLTTVISCGGGGGGGSKSGGSPNSPTPSDPSSVTITINIPEEGSRSVELINNNQFLYSYNLTSSPFKGVITGIAPNITYTANNNASGFDSFSYQLISNNPGLAPNKTVTVQINISGVNDRPVANNLEFFIQRGNSLIFNLSGSDPDGDALSYRVSIPPSRGALFQVNGSQFGYDADNDIYDLNFSYVVNDGVSDSLPANVTLRITKINQAPVLNSTINYSMSEDALNYPINISATDADNDPLIGTIITNPSNGIISGTYPNLIYTPNPNYNGLDSFRLRISDGFGGIIEPLINLTITSVNDIPIANNLTTDINSNAFFKQLNLTGIDPDVGQTLTYTLLSFPSKGIVDINSSGIATYVPYDNQSGTDTFTYRISDGISFSNIATVTLLFNQVINPPVAYNSNIAAVENVNTVISVEGFSLDANLTYELIDLPSKGTITGTGPDFTYKANLDQSGEDYFSFKIKDSQNQESNIAGVVITIQTAPIQYNGFLISGTAVEDKFLKNFSQSFTDNLVLNLENSSETVFSWLTKTPNICLATNNDAWEIFQVGITDAESDLQQTNFNFQNQSWNCDSKNKMASGSQELYSDGEFLLLSNLSPMNLSPQVWVGYNTESANIGADLITVKNLNINKVFSTNYAYVFQSQNEDWIEDTNIQGSIENKTFIKLLGFSKRLNPNDPDSQVELYSQLIDNGSKFSLFGLYYKAGIEMVQVLSHTNFCEIGDTEEECVEETINLNQVIGHGFNSSSKILLSTHYFLGEILTDETSGGDLTPDPNKDNEIRVEFSKRVLIYEESNL